MQQAQCVGHGLDTCVDSVNCLLKQAEAALQQGGLGRQRNTGGGMGGVLVGILWHQTSFYGSS